MIDTEPKLKGPDSAPLSNSCGWQGRLLFTLVAFFVLTGGIVFAIKLQELERPPQLVYPPSMQATHETHTVALRIEMGGSYPISNETIYTLMKAYGLKDCQVGGKYGAVCQDGTIERRRLLREDEWAAVCAQNGGVKEWIVCR